MSEPACLSRWIVGFEDLRAPWLIASVKFIGSNAAWLTKRITSHDFGLSPGPDGLQLGANRLWLSWHIPCG
jgi:hypothetical protein